MRNLTAPALIVVGAVVTGLTPSWIVIRKLDGITEHITEEVRKSMPAAVATLTSTVPCPKTGVDVEVNTPRAEGQTKEEWIDDHNDTVTKVQTRCALTTPPGGG